MMSLCEGESRISALVQKTEKKISLLLDNWRVSEPRGNGGDRLHQIMCQKEKKKKKRVSGIFVNNNKKMKR